MISAIDMGLAQILKAEYGDVMEEEAAGMPEFTSQADVDQYIARLETEMREAAKKFEFEKAARLRDTIKEIRDKEFLFHVGNFTTPRPCVTFWPVQVPFLLWSQKKRHFLQNLPERAT